jgi:hypothetical protein
VFPGCLNRLQLPRSVEGLFAEWQGEERDPTEGGEQSSSSSVRVGLTAGARAHSPATSGDSKKEPLADLPTL